MARCKGLTIRQQKGLMPPLKRCQNDASTGLYCAKHTLRGPWFDVVWQLLRRDWEGLQDAITEVSAVEPVVPARKPAPRPKVVPKPAIAQEPAPMPAPVVAPAPPTLPSPQEAEEWLRSFYSAHLAP